MHLGLRAHRRFADACSVSPFPEMMQGFELHADAKISDLGEAGWNHLEDDRLEIGQPRHDARRQLEQIEGHGAGVRIKPEATAKVSAGEMDFPDALQRQLLDVVADGLASV